MFINALFQLFNNNTRKGLGEATNVFVPTLEYFGSLFEWITPVLRLVWSP